MKPLLLVKEPRFVDVIPNIVRGVLVLLVVPLALFWIYAIDRERDEQFRRDGIKLSGKISDVTVTTRTRRRSTTTSYTATVNCPKVPAGVATTHLVSSSQRVSPGMSVEIEYSPTLNSARFCQLPGISDADRDWKDGPLGIALLALAAVAMIYYGFDQLRYVYQYATGSYVVVPKQS